MLPPKNRLTSRRDFETVKRLGAVLATPLFVLSYYDRGRKGGSLSPRFGFVASTHLSKRATKRNRGKRRLREAVRLFLKLEKEKIKETPLDAVFVLRKGILGQSYETISRLVNTFLPKIFKL